MTATSGVITTRALNNLRKIFLNGVQSVQPSSLLLGGTEGSENEQKKKISFDQKAEILTICGEEINTTNKSFHVVGFGKAVFGMAVALEGILSTRLRSGMLSVPQGVQRFNVGSESKENEKLCFGHVSSKEASAIKIFEGALNNLPDHRAMQTAIKIKNIASSMTKNDILFVLISGGGSALLPLPVESISLEEKLQIIRTLVSKGASINELNTVRISISQIKGGKLAHCARGAFKIISLVISDIVNDPLELIASGPTVPFRCDSNNSAESILKKYEIWNSLKDTLKSEIRKQENDEISIENSSVHLIGNNRIAANGCLRMAKNLGYHPFILSTSVTGNVTDITAAYISFLEALKNHKNNQINVQELITSCSLENLSLNNKNFVEFLQSWNGENPLCFILAGEPTVKIAGNGIGGRNQELAFRMSLTLHENSFLDNVYFLSAGTDGIDGPTLAAGALGCKEVIQDFLKSSDISKAKDFVARNDSYNFYKNLSDGRFHIITGHTGTNVMDLHLILVFS